MILIRSGHIQTKSYKSKVLVNLKVQSYDFNIIFGFIFILTSIFALTYNFSLIFIINLNLILTLYTTSIVVSTFIKEFYQQFMKIYIITIKLLEKKLS